MGGHLKTVTKPTITRYGAQNVLGRRAHQERILVSASIPIVELLLSQLGELDRETLPFSLWTEVLAYMPPKSAKKVKSWVGLRWVGQQKARAMARPSLAHPLKLFKVIWEFHVLAANLSAISKPQPSYYGRPREAVVMM